VSVISLFFILGEIASAGAKSKGYCTNAARFRPTKLVARERRNRRDPRKMNDPLYFRAAEDRERGVVE
jgi:hypothetical protein